ncbi:MAG: hypothetical protein AAF205_05405, partial [Pseudomonadota bacterium]
MSPWRFLAWNIGILAAAALLLALGARLIDTQMGRDLLVRQFSGLTLDNGLRIEARRVEGSLYGDLTIRDLTLSDPEGVFLTVPAVRLIWSPRAWLREDRLDVELLEAASADVSRLPRLKAGDGPLLPDFAMEIDAVRLFDVRLGERITGQPQRARLVAEAKIRGDIARVRLAAASPTGGDRVLFGLDAAPGADLFVVRGTASAPADGALAGATGIRQGFRARLAGDGGWSRWRGRLLTQLAAGADPLIDIAILGADGDFGIAGHLAPGQVAGRIGTRAAPDGLEVVARAILRPDDVPFRARVASSTFTARLAGTIDRDTEAFVDTKLSARLLRPAQLVRTLTGRAMRIDFDIDGTLGAPTADYRFAADWFALGKMRIEDFTANGRIGDAAADGDFGLLGRFDRVTGLGPFVEQLSTGGELSGPIDVDGLVFSSRRMSAATDLVGATGGFTLDLATGLYRIGLDFDAPAYPIPRVGIAAATGRLQFVNDPFERRKLTISGPVSARMTRLDSAFFRFLAGGLPSATANIVRRPDNVLVLNDVEFQAPDISGRGSGTLAPGTQLAFTGVSDQARFGINRFRLTGDLQRPRAAVAVDKYSLGLDLTDIQAVFVPQPDRYDARIAADTIVGPLAATGSIDTEPGRVAYRLDRAELAGVEAAGVLTPSGGIPVEGILALTGKGIDGTARFSAADTRQRIGIAVDLDDARFDTATVIGDDLTAAEGSVMADVEIAPDAARTIGTFDLAKIAYRGLLINKGAGSFDLSGTGTNIDARIEGRRGVAFALDTDIEATPQRLSVALDGRIDDRDVGLDAPIIADRRENGGWSIRPTRIELPRGTAQIAGNIGLAATQFDVDLDGVGLKIAQLALPNLPLGGTATGRLTYAASTDASPRASIRLAIDRFTRQSGV